MEPDVLFHTCLFKWFRSLAQLCGMDFFVDDYKPTARTYLLLCSLYVLLLSCIWTIYSFPFDGKIICASILCFDGQGIVKMNSFLSKTREFKDICDFSLKVYRANTKPSANKTRLQKSVNLTVFIFKGGMTLLISTAILTSLRPCITYFLFGEIETILPTILPGINEHETVGYTCLAAFHVYLLSVFVMGNAGADLGLMTLVMHTNAMSHIFQNAVNEFNGLVARTKQDNRLIHGSLSNLILMHIDYIKYTRMLQSVYNYMCLIQITMANTIMVVLVYVILMTDWFPAYFFMATAFFQVFEYSVLGTIVELANDNMYRTICNLMVVELPVREQKKVMFMTLLAQHPNNLTIGGFQLLNVETFVFSMKNTYSVAMLLVNTQKQ